MSEYLLEDYFGGSGGAADDSTDCTAAIQAALDDIHTNGKNGTLLFPSGICRMTGNAVKNFAHSGSNQGMLKIRGTGDSAVRLMGGSLELRFAVGGLQTAILENMVFLGDLTTGTTTEAYQAHVNIGGDLAVVDRCLFYGLGLQSSPGVTRGILWMAGEFMNVVKDCQFRGTWGNEYPNIFAQNFYSFLAENVLCLDYGVYQTTSYSKGGGGCPHWIDVNNTGSSGHIKNSRAVIRNCQFDEGAQTSAIRITDTEWALFENVGVNVSAAGSGPKLIRVRNVDIKQSNFGYTSSAGTVGLYLEDVKRAMLDGVRLIPGTLISEDGVDTIELDGTTQKVTLLNTTRGNAGSELPPIIINTAGAEILQDGIITRGGVTQIG